MTPRSPLASRAAAVGALAIAFATLVPTHVFADPLPLAWRRYENLHSIYRHSAVVDSRRDRLVVMGGYPVQSAFWAFDLHTPSWTELGSYGSRLDHSACYDPSRDAMFFYGGSSQEYAMTYSSGERYSFETSLSTPLQSGVLNLPGDPQNFNLLLDRAHDRLLVLGYSDTPPATVYSYVINTGVWSSQASAMVYPNVNVAKTAVVDAANDRVITLLGGVRQMTLSGTPTWTALPTGGTAPPALDGIAIMDSLRARVLLFRDDMSVWALSLGGSPEWSQVALAGAGPAARTKHSVTLDVERDRALLCGGTLTVGGTSKADVWAFDLATHTWQLLLDPGAGPEWRRDHTAVRASAIDALVVFGSQGVIGNTAYVWPLSGTSSGTRLSPSGTPPSARRLSALAYDSSRNRAYVFGGMVNSGGAVPGDVWALSLGGSPAWTDLSTSGGPSGRRSANAFWDPVRDRLIVVGGTEAGTYTSKTDIWALTLSGTPTWQRLVDDGTLPQIAEQPVAVYDSLRDRVVLVGLPYSGGSIRAWTFDLGSGTSWTDLSPAGNAFSNTQYFQGTLDTYGDRILLYGGIQWSNGYYSTELAALSLGASPAFTHPGASNPVYGRAYHSLTYDPIRYRSVLYGGMENPFGGDQYATSASVKYLQGDLAVPALASLAAAEVVDGDARLEWLVADADYATWRVERSLEQGEWTDEGAPLALGDDRLEFRDADLPAGAHVGYRLVAIENGVERRMGEAWITVPAANASLALSRAAFAGGSLRYAATLTGGGEARLDVYDVGGRLLGGARLGSARGERQGTLALHAPAAAGVYFVRLSQDGRTVVRKLARLD
ncbi:MAG: hypothetical protein U0704_05990 [Candidatus Eisenbacteria bacterium]